MRFQHSIAAKYQISSSVKQALLKYAEDHIDREDFFEKWRGDDAADLRQAQVPERDWREELRQTYDKFKKSFSSQAKEVNEGIVLWRCIDVPDIEEFLRDLEGKSLGIHWSYTREGAVCYWGKGGSRIVFKAIVPLKSIDMEENLLVNLDWINWDEMEIRLKSGSPVHVVGVDGKDVDVECKA